MILVKDLSFSYNDKNVLRDLNFSVKEKERVLLLGINGSGKSTLLKILNGLIFPNKGKYLYKGEEITEKNLKKKDFQRKFRKEVVLLFQNPDIMLFNPTCYDEIAFGLKQLNINGIDEKVKLWAEKVGISKYLKEPPFNLSGGEKQKLCLASLLVLEPELLLLDEPTANLDPKSTGWFIDFLNELQITTLISTHNLNLAEEMGQRAVVLSEEHKIIYDGNLKEFLKNKEKLKEANMLHIHKDKDFHLHFW